MTVYPTSTQRYIGCVHTWTRITFRKTFQNVIRTFPDLKAWFKSMWTQSRFKSGFWNATKRVFWIVIRLEKLILGHVNAKLFRNVSRACAFWKYALKPCWSHAWVNQCVLRSSNRILPRSAQILIVIGKAFAMHVNAHSSNHDPNHVLDRDPKRL